eukprot:s1469_g11.t1
MEQYVRSLLYSSVRRRIAMAKWIALLAAVAAAQVDRDLLELKAEVAAQQALIEAQEAMLQKHEVNRKLQATYTAAELTASVTSLNTMIYSMGGALDSAWLLLCGTLVMFMHAGFAMLETGCCRARLGPTGRLEMGF